MTFPSAEEEYTRCGCCHIAFLTSSNLSKLSPSGKSSLIAKKINNGNNGMFSSSVCIRNKVETTIMQWKKFLYSISVLSRAIEMSTGSGFPPPSDPPPPCLAKKCEREHVRERQSKEGRRLGTELWCLRGGKKKKKKLKKQNKGSNWFNEHSAKRPGERNCVMIKSGKMWAWRCWKVSAEDLWSWGGREDRYKR